MRLTYEVPLEGGCVTLPLNLDVERPLATVRELDPISDPRWKTFVDKHDRSSIFHSPGWLRALRNVYGYEPVVFTTNQPGVPLTNGIAFCRIRSWLTGSRLVSMPFSDHCEPLVGSSEELDNLLLYTHKYVDRGLCKYIEMRPMVFAPRISSNFGKYLTYCFHRLDLTRGSEEIFRSLHKDCVQRKIRRAEKEKLKYEEGRSDELLQKFYRLMVVMRQRKSLPPQPLAWFKGLVAELGKDLQIRVASYGNLPVASIITLTHNKTMTYKYGCSDAAFNKLGGMALLFWRAIQDAKAAGYDELDFGRSDSDNLGLIAFKDHWGATSSSLTYWKYPKQTVHSKIWQHQLVKRVSSATPTMVLKAIGRVLYKHIG